MDMIFKILITSIILVLAVMDLLKKEVPVWIITVLFVVATIARIVLGIGLYSLVAGLSVGGVMLGLAFLTKEKVGIGDGLITLCLGIFLGGERILKVLLLASLIMTLVSAILLVSKKGSMNTTLPFIPAILFGLLIV